MSDRLVKPLIPQIVRNLDYLVGFLRKSGKERETLPILRISPYYRWLAYSIIRRELFEEVRTWTDRHMDAEGYLIDRLYDDLIEVWRELKEYGLEGPVRSGIMHEVLYWVASLRAQKQADRVFFIAPIHEGIPRLIHTKKLEAEEERQEEFQFRGDFCIFWGIASKEAQTAVVDVKSDYGTAIGDGKLLRTVKQFHRLGLQFFVASPEPKIEDFEYMKKERYLLDLRKWWSHRPLQLDGYTSGPYPESIAPPWLLNP